VGDWEPIVSGDLFDSVARRLVRATGTLPIFDVDHMLRVEDYSPNLWPSTVVRDVDKLADHIKAAWDSRDTTATYMDILRS